MFFNSRAFGIFYLISPTMTGFFLYESSFADSYNSNTFFLLPLILVSFLLYELGFVDVYTLGTFACDSHDGFFLIWVKFCRLIHLELKRKRGDPTLIIKEEAWRVELTRKLKEVKRCLANQVEQLKIVWSNNHNMEDKLLRLA